MTNWLFWILTSIAVIGLYFYLSHWLSYDVLKVRILKRQKWDLNICCGKTDGGGVNVDIMNHKKVPNFVQVDDIYKLPFRDKAFDTVLTSHTLEHVDDPRKFYNELQRVGKKVTIVLPPVWDITAALNVFEHKYIFLIWRKEHDRLPPFVKLPLASFIQKKLGQKIKG